MGNIVVAMPKIEDARKLAGVLRSRGYQVGMVCSKGDEVLQCVNQRNFGVLVCGYRLLDMNHIELLHYLPKYFEMILVTSESKLDSCAEEPVKVTLPLYVPGLTGEIDKALARVEKKYSHDKKGPGSRSEEDRKIIEDAQKKLMDERGMGHVESYRYIQKRSMDSSMGMVEMAKRILENG